MILRQILTLTCAALLASCASAPILLKELPQSRNDLFPQTGTCPAQFAFIHREGIAIVINHEEKAFSPLEGVRALMALPKSCDNNFTLWYESDDALIYDGLIAPVLEALKDEKRRFNAAAIEIDGERVWPKALDDKHALIRVPLSVDVVHRECVDDEVTAREPAVDYDSGDAFSYVRVRYYFSYGQMVVLVPKAAKDPESENESVCITRWKTSPAKAKIVRTLLPVVLERDDENETCVRWQKKNVPVGLKTLDAIE